MNKEQLNKLLDATYDFEAMLLLLNSRIEDEEILKRAKEKAIYLKSLIEGAFEEKKDERVVSSPEEELSEKNDDIKFDDNLFYQLNEEQNFETSNNESVPAPLKLSINDRFRFKRELFYDSDSELQSVINYINKSVSYEEVESELVGNMNMDPEDPVVEEFLELVKRRFE